MGETCYRIEPQNYILSAARKDMPDNVSIDDWMPAPKRSEVFRVPSEWRAMQNKQSACVTPSRDDLYKIRAHLKNGVSRVEIQRIFRLSDAMFKKIIDGALIVKKEREQYLAVRPDCIDTESDCERD
jgi:hypothetical protein